MTNLLPNPDVREPNSSAVLAVFRALRRQPWKPLAITTWDIMKRFLQLATAALVTFTLPAHAGTYEAVNADVPFKFNVGNRAFRPGHYQLVFVGPGMLALRDARQNIVASLVTRSVDMGGPASTSKLVFKIQKKHAHLAQIWIENKSQVVEVTGEEVAVRQFPAPLSTPLPANVASTLFDRRAEPGLKH